MIRMQIALSTIHAYMQRKHSHYVPHLQLCTPVRMLSNEGVIVYLPASRDRHPAADVATLAAVGAGTSLNLMHHSLSWSRAAGMLVQAGY
jgi:hypothetical protein